MDGKSWKKLVTLFTDIANPFIGILPITHLTVLLSSGRDYTSFFVSLAFQIILPVVLLYYMIRRGYIKDRELTDRTDRRIYFLCLSVLFFIAYLLSRSYEFQLINLMLLIAVFCAWFIGLYWKISGHLLFDTIAFLALSQMYPVLYPLLLLLPLIAYSRVYLHKHTIFQTLGGAVLGVIIFVGVYQFLTPNVT